ncbi:MAG: bifunctional glutamate N-acetyltransferase/amino-acid acetyltransferase ArgJ [Acidobacteria bacterium]|nr:bifunctional glutamate N-acetyltransferase/amino-acid acetyltransferase ArgJ [Acidobacteriota bacterium]
MRSARITDGSVTSPRGFRAAGLHCGIKANGRADLALLVSDVPATAAGVFTTNLAKAAPVRVSQAHLMSASHRTHAIITNSGCANACTGPQGDADASEMAQLTATTLGCAADEVLVASTGVIGVNLKMDAIRRGIPLAMAALSEDGGAAAARAIMTTDPFPKSAAVQVTTDVGTFTVGGMTKGSGMIEPRMATMLGYLTTDASVDATLLFRALTEACRFTFNAITVDGEPSTNDCVFALANGMSGVVIDETLYPALVEGLRQVSHELALAIVRGGEGATKLVAITTTGAATDADAWMAARAIANSPLVKTAVHGADPNWGRLVAAAGRSGAAFVLDRARVRIGSLVLFENGRPFDERAPEAAAYLGGTDLAIEVNLGAGGSHTATVWTCDLTAEYVKINAEYRT